MRTVIGRLGTRYLRRLCAVMYKERQDIAISWRATTKTRALSTLSGDVDSRPRQNIGLICRSPLRANMCTKRRDHKKTAVTPAPFRS